MYGIRNSLFALGVVAGAVVLTGCFGGAPTLDVEYVEGVVSLDGTPVDGATVMFIPVTEGQGLSASGFTDDKGVYKLTVQATGGDVEAPVDGGTQPGEYYVGVIKSVAETPMTEEEAEEKGVEYKAPKKLEGPKVQFLVPEKYKIPQRSGLKVTVAEGDNNIPLELTSK